MLRNVHLLILLVATGLAACGDGEVRVSACSAPEVLFPVDLVIDGPGFFITKAGGELRYSPRGRFCADPSGLVINDLGQPVQVYAQTVGGGFNQGDLLDLVAPADESTGEMPVDLMISTTGVVEAVYTAGSNVLLGKLALGTFHSPQNLVAESGTVCRETLLSGVAYRGEASEDGFGAIRPGIPDPFTCDQGRFDLQVEGDGYFVLNDAGVARYATRTVFGVDALSYYVDDHGYRISGYAVDADGTLIPAVVDLTAPADRMPPAATSSIAVALNLDSGAGPPPVSPFDPNDPLAYNFSTGVTIFDSLGVAYSATFYFVKTAAAATWELHLSFDGVPGSAGGNPTQELGFSGGVLSSPGTIVWGLVTLNNGANDLAITLDLDGVTQTSAGYAVGSIVQNGYAQGIVTATHISAAGEIRMDYGNGQTGVLQGQIVLAKFPAPSALVRSNDRETYVASPGAGAPTIDVPGVAGLGDVAATAR